MKGTLLAIAVALAAIVASPAVADWRVISTESRVGIVSESDGDVLMIACDGDRMIVALTLPELDAEPGTSVPVDLRLGEEDPFTTHWLAGSTRRTVGLTRDAEAFPAALYFADIQTLGVEVGEIATEFDVGGIGEVMPELPCYE